MMGMPFNAKADMHTPFAAMPGQTNDRSAPLGPAKRASSLWLLPTSYLIQRPHHVSN